MFPRPGSSQQGETLTVQVKNTALELNGQNLRLEAKNGRSSKTPGLHLSAVHGKEAVGQLTASSTTREGAAQLDLLLFKSPRPDLERHAENKPVRRPLKLAPLELTEEVREAQKEKLKFIQEETEPVSCKLDVTQKEPRTRKVKSCMRQRLAKAAACPSSSSTEPLKAQQQNRLSRPQLTRAVPVQQSGDKHLVDVVCRGTPAPLRSKPAPPSQTPRVKAAAARGGEAARQSAGALQQETGRRRLRLRRAQHLEEDQCNSNTSTGGLSADEAKPAQGVQGKGLQTKRTQRGQLHAGKAIKEPPAPAGSREQGSARKSHQEGGSQQSAKYTLS
ncbi:uncharacterized protein LOC125020230 [Mugil cephalus]|uniref:uncharacterized protein LOC125020230 n=1 Tax=Mugil cephalus TaxID=48193 RepID=UPI001FB5A87A|nr:uncharacterized protein LOC125020230 [Mugil cephalus]